MLEKNTKIWLDRAEGMKIRRRKNKLQNKKFLLTYLYVLISAGAWLVELLFDWQPELLRSPICFIALFSSVFSWIIRVNSGRKSKQEQTKTSVGILFFFS